MLFKASHKLYNTQEREILVECSCGTHLIKICSFDDEKEVFLELWSSNFYSKQKKNIFGRCIDRLKLIWYATIGREYRLEDVILEEEDVNKLIEALQEIQSSKQEVKS